MNLGLCHCRCSPVIVICGMERFFIALLLSALCHVINAQRIVSVKGEYTYYAPENVSPEAAKRIALERAIIQALADEFGTIVVQTSHAQMSNTNGQSHTDFQGLTDSEVKGEWMETLGEPEYFVSYEDNTLVVKCAVKGKAREIETAPIDLRIKILCNGTDDKFENCSFRSGDDLFVSFQTPVKGFLVIYLVDAAGNSYCLLPYQRQSTGIYEVNNKQKYIFFSPGTALNSQEAAEVDEYVLTCEKGNEQNQIYVIFSPERFHKASDNGVAELLPRQLPVQEFRRWMFDCRKRDKQMQVRIYPITINQ